MRYWTRYLSQLPHQEHEEEEEEPQREITPPEPRLSSRRPHPTGGEPLSPLTRTRLEQSLGADLSGVRLHHDPSAAEAIGARGYTDGQNIVVADRSDQDVIAHEAAHIVQAARRGIDEGISTPDSPAEREARTASEAVRSGEVAPLTDTGAPVPSLQRDDKQPASSTDLIIQRETVRLMLQLQYSQQKGGGAFRLTPALKAELQRLLPGVDDAAVIAVWTPDPAGPMEAFLRLSNAGYLPMIAGAPRPEEETPKAPEPKKEEPVPEPDKKKELSTKVGFIGPNGLGIHLVINPQAPAPISAVIRQELAGRGLPISYDQIQSLLAGRKQGIDQIDRILKQLLPGLGRDKRDKLAATVADILLTRSIQGQLRREAQNGVERNVEVEANLDNQLGIPRKSSGPMLDLLGKVPLGISVTIHF